MEIRTVEQWHKALNADDTARLVGLSHQDVEMGGPRGVVSGAGVLREWVDRANIRLYPRRFFHEGETVVVEEAAEWRSLETGEVTGKDTVSSVFIVREGLVARVARYENPAGALDAVGLNDSHEAKPD